MKTPDVVADHDTQVDEAVATEDALLADSSPSADLHVGPDLGPLADNDVVVDLCRRGVSVSSSCPRPGSMVRARLLRAPRDNRFHMPGCWDGGRWTG